MWDAGIMALSTMPHTGPCYHISFYKCHSTHQDMEVLSGSMTCPWSDSLRHWSQASGFKVQVQTF